MMRTWKGLVLSLAGIALLAAPALSGDKKGGKEAGGIAWVRDYQAAVKQAGEEGKWLFIDFYSDG